MKSTTKSLYTNSPKLHYGWVVSQHIPLFALVCIQLLYPMCFASRCLICAAFIARSLSSFEFVLPVCVELEKRIKFPLAADVTHSLRFAKVVIRLAMSDGLNSIWQPQKSRLYMLYASERVCGLELTRPRKFDFLFTLCILCFMWRAAVKAGQD
jgi:hypothetical protein